MYFPTWFEIKHHCKLTCGSENFTTFLQELSVFQIKKVIEIALKVLQNNEFFALTKNILLDMLGDDDKDLWRIAVNKSCSLRSKRPRHPIENNNFEELIEPSSVSTKCTASPKFLITKINFRAKSFHKMVNLNLSVIHEPSETK